MVDVLCCALGCVILLWILNFRDAKQRAATAGQTNDVLAQTRKQLDAILQTKTDLEKQLQAVRQEQEKAQVQYAATSKERDLLQQDLTQARNQMKDLEKTVAALKLDVVAAEDRLAKKAKEEQVLAKELSALKTLQSATDAQLTRKTEEHRKIQQEIETAQKQLASLQTLLRERETQAKSAAKSVDEAGQRLKTAEERVLVLEKSLLEQKAQTELATKARFVAENRFAGIALTGRRVIFLVDMSASMNYTDSNTEAPDKWLAVRDALLRIMRSLTDLEKFQVLLFNQQATFLLGSDDQWLAYDAKTSPERVGEALAAVKPKGNTNMYAAFETAFRYRADGLDTIYLLSDGLPNIGTGLDPANAAKLTDAERTFRLSNHVRRTLLDSWNRPLAGKPQVRINSVGFFYESPDVGAFLWALSREHQGSFVGMSKP